MDFFIIVVALALISAVLLQGFHELLRAALNRLVLRNWLKRRKYDLDVAQFCAAMGGSGTASLSLPYWQLTGQIAAALSSELNLYPSSKLVDILANCDERYHTNLDHQLAERGVPVENRKAAILRDVAARAQAGINSLHVKLRIMSNIFDYALSLLITSSLAALFTTLEETQGQRYLLYAGVFFSWLATPMLRRMIENLVPFR